MPETQGRQKVGVFIYIDSELREIAAADCKARDVNLNDVVSKLLAEFYQRPDLAIVPRKRLGRPIRTGTGTKSKASKQSQPKKA